MDGTTTAAPAATLIDRRGNATILDDAAYAAVRTFMHAVGIAPKDDDEDSDVRLTTGQAAKILGTSSKTVARLIDSGKLPGSRTGVTHRSVMLSDLVAYERTANAGRRANLQKARDIADDEGFYDDDTPVLEYLEAFK